MPNEVPRPKAEVARNGGHIAAGYPARFSVFPPLDVAIGCVAGHGLNIAFGVNSEFTPNNEASVYLMSDGTLQDGNGTVFDCHS